METLTWKMVNRSQSDFEKLSQGMREVIKQSKEYKEMFIHPKAEPKHVAEYNSYRNEHEDEATV
jgi:hypothetical protein